jgi:hypothetical protein
MEQTLQDIATAFIAAKEAEAEAKARQTRYNKMLKEAMAEESQTEVIVGKKRIVLTNREKIKFDAAIVTYLKNSGLNTYIIEAVDDTGLRAEIKRSPMLATAVEKYTIKTEEQVLTIAEV